ncbi:hypothetical protein GGP41_006328 [Bipolaris sorokiniana]|uniref:N-acetyltransferase domain-containing protein n=1 Tax=Cochliobolus sativus TaxID=45130 RepID=A0A8H5ZHR5_COCSA|nr:hypothetical protein GGP41_006328 [Bipolaris sorokiniana]
MKDSHLCTSLSQPPELEPTRLESLDTHTDMPKQQKNIEMTSHQEADFAQAPPDSRRKHRAQQPTTLPSPRHVSPAALAETSLPNQDETKNASNPPGFLQKKYTRNKKSGKKETNMTMLRKEAYVPPHLRSCPPANRASIPPHLRNRPSANEATIDPGHNNAATNGSPSSSNKSKSTVATKPESVQNQKNIREATPPSPATTPHEPVEHENQDMITPENVWGGWNGPEINHPHAHQKTANPRWNRGPQPYKRKPWPKQRDMKYIPDRSDSDGGVNCWSDSNGDPDYDVKKLLDWNGDWLPAPESWSARRGHEDRHLGANVEQWMNGHSQECTRSIYCPLSTFSPEDGPCKELAPRYWLEAKVEGSNLRESWKTISTSDPKPLDDMDLTGHAPWWEMYEDVVYSEAIHEDGQDEQHLKHRSCYLNGLPTPEARIDPTDAEHPTTPLMLASAAEKLEDLQKRREAKERRLLAKRNRLVPNSTFLMQAMEDRRLRPQANMYIRPVQPADVVGIGAIYNYYVEHTIYATEFDGRTEDHIRQRINTVTSAGLPYLVAISKSNESKVTPGYVTEKIVGFISLDDYCSQASSFRYTFEMELFVHPGYTSKGIGKCLVDRLLEMADTSYRARGGYQYINNFEYLKTGPSRVIKTILLNVHHKNGEHAETGWQGQFLCACKFHRVGRLPKVGYKNNTVIDVAIYAHHTNENIDAGARPTIM